MIKKSSNVCNVQQAVLNMGNNPELFKKHFNKFKDSSGEIFDQLNHLVSDKHFSDTAVLCHSMKGLSSMLCFTTLQTHMSEAESFFKNIDSPQNMDKDTLDGINTLISFIQQDIQAICRLEI